MTKEERQKYNKEYHKKYYAQNKEKLLLKNKEYLNNNPEKKKEFNARYNKKYREKRKEFLLKKRFGISLDEYNLLFSEQEGCCAICGAHQSELSKSLAVDHCHSSGKIRGLLCIPCNVGIGNLQEKIEILESAIKYLDKDVK